ncbi:MAG: hypothetical protein U0528_13365 [Anaerolineae bacterium]
MGPLRLPLRSDFWRWFRRKWQRQIERGAGGIAAAIGKLQGAEKWFIATMYPGAYPLEELEWRC